MSIYVSRSPYRQYSTPTRKGFRLPSFAGISGIFKRKNRLSRTVSARSAPRVRRGNSGESVGAMVASAASAGVQSVVTAKQFFHSVKSKKVHFEFGPGTVMISLGVIAAVMSLSYLVHFNKVATKGYDLRRLEAERQELLSQYDVKNMKVAEATSLNYIINSDRLNGMRKPGEVIFVRSNTAIASR